LKDDGPDRVRTGDFRDHLLGDSGSHRVPGTAATAPTGVLREGKGEERDHWYSYCHPQEREKGTTRKVQILRSYAFPDKVTSFIYADIHDYRSPCLAAIIVYLTHFSTTGGVREIFGG
jgi:hypothetical protein